MPAFAWPILAAFLAPQVMGTEPPERQCLATRISAAPVIDGDLSDGAWESAPPCGDFVQRFPHPGDPVSFPTEVRLLYDREALYLGVRLLDPEPEGIIARLTRRDRIIESDSFTVDIDSRHDHRSGFFFSVNAAGVQVDGTTHDEKFSSTDWDGLWESAIRITATGWELEMRIPLKLLRFQASSRVGFGINFTRRVSRLNETDLWRLVPPESGLWVSQFGHLDGLDLTDRPVSIEVAPYAVLRLDLGSDDGRQSLRPFDLGADARVGLGGNFMLTLTANPDFGQVEADEVVLNLSTIETYYREKRPFFLEDRSLFQTPVVLAIGGATPELFYTRGYGRAPRDPEIREGEALLRAPPLPRIYGAAKLASQTDGRLSVGLLQAVTSAESAGLAGADGLAFDRIAEPLTSFSVLRVRQDFLDHSAAGLMMTSTAAPGEGAALTGGADLQMELLDDRLKLSALGFASYLTSARGRWQDDFTRAALDREGPLGYGGHLMLAKTSGDHWIGSIGGMYYSANLALNDLGYLDRADRWMATFHVRHHRLKPLGALASYSISLSGWIDRNTAGLNLGDGFYAEAEGQLTSGWSAGVWGFSAWPLCDDRETRSAGRVALCGRAHRWRAGLTLISDPRQLVVVAGNLEWQSTERGDRRGGGLDLSFNPHPRIQIDLIPSYRYLTGAIRWIDTQTQADGERFLFADQHTEYWDLILRQTLTFTNAITLQAFAQLFVASVDHGAKLSTPQGPVGSRIPVGSLVPAPDIPDDYDFTTSNLNVGVVLRWEYLPGSVGYLVYTAALGHNGAAPEFRFGSLVEGLLDSGGTHTLLLKLSYLWE